MPILPRWCYKYMTVNENARQNTSRFSSTDEYMKFLEKDSREFQDKMLNKIQIISLQIDKYFEEEQIRRSNQMNEREIQSEMTQNYRNILLLIKEYRKAISYAQKDVNLEYKNIAREKDQLKKRLDELAVQENLIKLKKAELSGSQNQSCPAMNREYTFQETPPKQNFENLMRLYKKIVDERNNLRLDNEELRRKVNEGIPQCLSCKRAAACQKSKSPPVPQTKKTAPTCTNKLV